VNDRWAVHLGDCREVMKAMEPESIDSIVSDPPYGLSFMGKGWDHGVPGVEFWEAALRVAKPGAHLLAFGGTRTFHRLTVAIEDAGWDIRDCVMWVYAQGFPKSHDVSKAIDREAGAEREVVGRRKHSAAPGTAEFGQAQCSEYVYSAPATDAARQWSGWGTALKPAYEPIIVARKPLRGTVAGNVLEWGTGGINVDGCRVGFHGEADKAAAAAAAAQRACQDQNKNRTAYGEFNNGPASLQPYLDGMDKGRWPANLIHDGSDEVVGLFPQQTSGANPTRRNVAKFQNAYGEFAGQEECTAVRGADSGSAARFFYCAKASKRDRDEGCEGMPVVDCGTYAQDEWTRQNMGGFAQKRRNHHPTVKPTDLMRYLCRLVTPPDGLVFDPFTGSGSTGKAAMLEGFRFVGAELSPEYIEIARARIGHAAGKTRQKELALA